MADSVSTPSAVTPDRVECLEKRQISNESRRVTGSIPDEAPPPNVLHRHALKGLAQVEERGGRRGTTGRGGLVAERLAQDRVRRRSAFGAVVIVHATARPPLPHDRAAGEFPKSENAIRQADGAPVAFWFWR